MTISKELAQRLVDAGIVVKAEKEYTINYKGESLLLNKDEDLINKKYPSPSSDELLAVLPRKIGTNKIIITWHICEWSVSIGYLHKQTGCYIAHEVNGEQLWFENESLPEALGNLLLKLAEDGLLNKEEV